MLAAELTRLREVEFPWARDRIYLNNASIGPIPLRTQRAIDAIAAKRRDPGQFSDGELPSVLTDARTAVARLLHASTDEIALAPNTSYGINMAAQVLPLRAGDVVLVPDGEFPANVYPWMLQARRGVQTELVPRTAQGWPDEARLLERVADPRVRAVAVSFVQFATGYRVDRIASGPLAGRTGPSSSWMPFRGWDSVPSTCAKRRWTSCPAGRRNGSSDPGGRGFSTCAGSS